MAEDGIAGFEERGEAERVAAAARIQRRWRRGRSGGAGGLADPIASLVAGGRLALVAVGGDADAVHAKLDRGADANEVYNGGTALHWAAQQGHAEVVTVLLQRGARPDEPHAVTGSTPLHIAAQEGKQAVVAALLERGASCDARNGAGHTPLHRAAQQGQLAALQALLPRVAAAGAAALDAQDSQGKTSLFNSCWKGHALCVRALLEVGADASVAANGLTPLQAAERGGHSEAVAVLQHPPARRGPLSDDALLEALLEDALRVIDAPLAAMARLSAHARQATSTAMHNLLLDVRSAQGLSVHADQGVQAHMAQVPTTDTPVAAGVTLATRLASEEKVTEDARLAQAELQRANKKTQEIRAAHTKTIREHVASYSPMEAGGEKLKDAARCDLKLIFRVFSLVFH